jgi:hypothetical protein
MQRELIHFNAVSASSAKRTAAGFALGDGARQLITDLSAACVLDEAFANYTRVDAGSSSIETPSAPIATNWRAETRELIASISTQLKTLDGQRRQLARLLDRVEPNATF